MALGRHPRYTIALIVVLLITTILIFNNPGSYDNWSVPGYSSGGGKSISLSKLRGYKTIDLIRETEEEYQRSFLPERRKMIRKYGPTVGQVEAFPSTWKMYTLWDFFIPAFQCPHHVARLGTLGDGGKWMCGMERLAHKKDCVIYSFGINGESSFEAELLRKAPGCQVWGYDYSVAGWGPELTAMSLSSRSHFQPWALGAKDVHNPTDNDPKDEHGVPIKFWTLRKLMEHNGHKFIDILKVDIEGAEFTSLNSFFDFYESQPSPKNPSDSPMDFSPDGAKGSPFIGAPLPIGQMQIEIHAMEGNELAKDFSTFSGFLGWWERMERLGLRPFWTEPNLVYMNMINPKNPDLSEYAFINIRGSHELLIDELVDKHSLEKDEEGW